MRAADFRGWAETETDPKKKAELTSLGNLNEGLGRKAFEKEVAADEFKEGAEREAGGAAEGQQAGAEETAAASQVLTNKPDRRFPTGRTYSRSREHAKVGRQHCRPSNSAAVKSTTGSRDDECQ